MTKLLQQALERVRALSPEEQDDVANMIMAAMGDDVPEAVDPAHLGAVLEGLARARAREFASDDEVEAALRSFDS